MFKWGNSWLTQHEKNERKIVFSLCWSSKPEGSAFALGNSFLCHGHLHTCTFTIFMYTQRNKSYFLCLDVIESTLSMLQYFTYYIKTVCPSFTVEPCARVACQCFWQLFHTGLLFDLSLVVVSRKQTAVWEGKNRDMTYYM